MQEKRFGEELMSQPFKSYDEYMSYIFACVNYRLSDYIGELKKKYDAGQGNYKNVMYPDIEIAHGLCSESIFQFLNGSEEAESNTVAWEKEFDDELRSILEDFGAGEDSEGEEDAEGEGSLTVESMLTFIDARLKLTDIQKVPMPFYELCQKRKFGHFTVFTLAAAILSATQTSYASVFQVVNENGSLTAPTVESAGRLYFGEDYSITKAYSEMSVCLENLLPIMDLKVNSNMPFSTLLAPDKRLIDFLFGKNPMRLDENFSRFFCMLTDEKELDPIMANDGQLEAMEISYQEGTRIFSWYGDEGSGRRFFIKHFCKKNGKNAIIMNCKKLFVYDYSFVEKALWSVNRECIFTDACC